MKSVFWFFCTYVFRKCLLVRRRLVALGISGPLYTQPQCPLPAPAASLHTPAAPTAASLPAPAAPPTRTRSPSARTRSPHYLQLQPPLPASAAPTTRTRSLITRTRSPHYPYPQPHYPFALDSVLYVCIHRAPPREEEISKEQMTQPPQEEYHWFPMWP